MNEETGVAVNYSSCKQEGAEILTPDSKCSVSVSVIQTLPGYDYSDGEEPLWDTLSLPPSHFPLL